MYADLVGTDFIRNSDTDTDTDTATDNNIVMLFPQVHTVIDYSAVANFLSFSWKYLLFVLGIRFNKESLFPSIMMMYTSKQKNSMPIH